MCNASSRPAASHPTAMHWIPPRHPFFLPVKVLSVFRRKFVVGLRRAFARGTLVLPGDLHSLADEQAFRAFLRSLFRQDGSSTPNHPLADPSTSCSIWGTTPTAWRSLIIGSSMS